MKTDMLPSVTPHFVSVRPFPSDEVLVDESWIHISPLHSTELIGDKTKGHADEMNYSKRLHFDVSVVGYMP